MNLKAIFGTTFLSVLVALALYDLFLKGIIGGFFNKYDDTFEPKAGKQVRMKSQRELIDILRKQSA